MIAPADVWCNAMLGSQRASIVLAEEHVMPTITVRNVPPKVVQSLKALAKRHNRSMEQEVRDLLEGYVVERRAILDQIEAGWQLQTRRPTAAEVDAWMAVGRP
jgi:plasmid stability protein